VGISGLSRTAISQRSQKKGPHSTSFQPSIFAPLIPSWLAKMRVIDILSLILSFLGIYGLFFALRLLLPRNIVPSVSTSLTEVMALLEHAEANNISNTRDHRANLAILHNQFLQMRTESHRSPGFCQQFCLLFLCGLTWRLYDLRSRIETIRRKIEV